ncbi:MAG: ketosteroid isomerase-like protein [Gammaproteobacteria bacterium]|jgi:ketosteroid isomerase-like protein
MNKIEITKIIYAAAVAGEWDTVEKHIHPEFTVIESEGLPYGGKYKGVKGFQDVARTVFKFFERLAVEPLHYMEGDGYVVAIVSFKGKGKLTGKSFESDLLELFRFEGDKVIEIKPYYWNQQLIKEV